MREVLRSNDVVLISFAECLLRDAGIGCAVVDQHMSVLVGSGGLLPRRILVDPEMHARAERILAEAGLESTA
jgi:hypothetical protein